MLQQGQYKIQNVSVSTFNSADINSQMQLFLQFSPAEVSDAIIAQILGLSSHILNLKSKEPDAEGYYKVHHQFDLRIVTRNGETYIEFRETNNNVGQYGKVCPLRLVPAMLVQWRVISLMEQQVLTGLIEKSAPIRARVAEMMSNREDWDNSVRQALRDSGKLDEPPSPR